MALPTPQQLVNMYVAGGNQPLTTAQILGTAPASTSVTTSTGGGATSSTSQQAALQAQIATIQGQLAPLQQQLSVATQTGLKGTDQIPAALVSNPQQYLADWTASQTKVPEPDTSTMEGIIAKIKAEIASGEKTSAQIDKELGDLEAQYGTSKKTWLDYVTGEKKLDIQGERAKLEAQYGAQPAAYIAKRNAELAEVEGLKNNYNAAVAARDLQLSGERERQAPMEFITARTGRMERDANIRLNQMSANINTKLATMEAERGNFMDAQTLINQAVQDYTAQYKWQYNITKDYMDQNYTQIQNLKSEQRSIMDNVLNLSLKTYELKLNQTTTIGDMILKYPSAGIKISDTIEEATRKASIVAAQQEVSAQTQQGIENAQAWARINNEETKATGTVLTDEEIRAQIRQFKQQNPEATYQDAIDAITTNEYIANKDRARLITGELFNVSPTDWQSVVFPTSTSFFESLYK